MDLVKVLNTGSTPLTLKHDDVRAGGDITIAPGESRIVRGDYVALNFGNPGARNEGRNRVREADHKNLLTRWGFYSGLYPDAAWEEEALALNGTVVGPFKPQFECWTVTDSSDTAQRIWTILDDPEGTRVNPTAGAVVVQQNTDVETLHAQIAAMAAQMASLTNLVAQLTTEGAPRTADTDAKPTTGVADTGGAGAGAGGSTETQESRNEQRDQIPAPPVTEPPVTTDRPRTRRVGG